MQTILSNLADYILDVLYGWLLFFLELITIPVQYLIESGIGLVQQAIPAIDYSVILPFVGILDDFFPVQYAYLLFQAYLTLHIVCIGIRVGVKVSTLGQG